MSTDSTAVRSAASLREAAACFESLFNANILGIAIAEAHRVINANDEYLRQVGVTRDEFERENVDWQSLTPPEHLPKDVQAMVDMTEHGHCVPFEKEYVLRDGTRVPIQVGAAMIQRDPLRWIGYTLDLTQQKRAKAERDRMLAEALSAREVTEAALRARDAVLAKVTHDLRTPIAANVGYAAIMSEGIPEPLPQVFMPYVERIIANQYHMVALLDQLLDFSRGSAGPRVYDCESLSVKSLIDDIESLVAPQARAAGITYTATTPENPEVSVFADRTRTIQVLSNLVGNATKFTPSGGSVMVSTHHTDDEVSIHVVDTGRGIPADQFEAIFQPFTQVTSGAERSDSHPRGFGLGLAISRELARGMGGDITVESVVGVGSTFTLMLPRG